MENIQQTMYLSTIPNNKKHIINKPNSLDVSDISGTRSRYLQHPRPQRNNQSKLHSFDIDKTKPRQLIPQVVNRPNYCYQIDDIKGTRTKINKFTTTRNTNPLIPQYQNPKVVYLIPQQTKFIKDSLAIDDIQGSRGKQTFILKLQRANKTINTKDQIQKDIKPTPKGFLRANNTNDSLKVEDINQGDLQYANKHIRTTNPLQPVYSISGNISYGNIEGTKCNPFIKCLRINNSLKTQDIQGCRTKINNFVSVKKDEIIGTKTQSLKRGVSSNRQTNPLQPKYNYPGWSQVSNNCHFTRPKTAIQKFDLFIK